MFIVYLFSASTKECIWSLGKSPIDVERLSQLLIEYPNNSASKIIFEGFKYGFPIHYSGPRTPVDCQNLKSIIQHPIKTQDKIQSEIDLGRISGPYEKRPISNLRCSPIGLVPKKTGGFRLITHLSFPPGNSVNSNIDTVHSSVQYSPFDHAISLIQKVGRNALCGKHDIKSAFRLLPIYPGCFDLLGFKFNGCFYIDKMLPMGRSQSCSYFETFSTFIEWVVKTKSKSDNVDHYLDDFFFVGKAESDECKNLMNCFVDVCNYINVPVAHEKTEGPSTVIEYLGLTIDTVNMLIKIPKDKIVELQEKIGFVLSKKRVQLRILQSLAGSFAFCTRAIPAGRTFIRSLYALMSKVRQPHHYVRVTNAVKSDLLVWLEFLSTFNGISFILDKDWSSSDDLQLYTDSAGGETKGCGVYYSGKWAMMQWPTVWANTEILKDITYLELVPIALAIYLWGCEFKNKRILFFSDNSAVVSIINNKSSKSERVMSLLRYIVYWTLTFNFQLKCKHIPSFKNKIADSISRGQVEYFRQLAPAAQTYPTTIPVQFWSLLCKKPLC